MECPSCRGENPDDARYCSRCGRELVRTPSQTTEQRIQTKDFVAAQAQKTVAKMLETPGTIALAIGLLLLLFAVIAGAVDHWGWAIGLGFVSIVILYVAIQIRSQEARIAAAQVQHAPRVYQSMEISERVIVKFICSYCVFLNPDGCRNCGSCGATM